MAMAEQKVAMCAGRLGVLGARAASTNVVTRARLLRAAPPARAAVRSPARAMSVAAAKTVQVGDKLPEATLIEGQSNEVKLHDLFRGASSSCAPPKLRAYAERERALATDAGKTGVLLGMPGALMLRVAPRRHRSKP